jgi:hypothetical protein
MISIYKKSDISTKINFLSRVSKSQTNTENNFILDDFNIINDGMIIPEATANSSNFGKIFGLSGFKNSLQGEINLFLDTNLENAPAYINRSHIIDIEKVVNNVKTKIVSIPVSVKNNGFILNTANVDTSIELYNQYNNTKINLNYRLTQQDIDKRALTL